MISTLATYFKRISLPLVCCVLLSMTGGYWVVLQSFAWAQMLIEYTETGDSFAEAAQKTFSGDFPCSMCKEIEKGREHEKQESIALQNFKKHEVFYTLYQSPLPLPDEKPYYYPASSPVTLSSRSDAPPTPVPILV
ncbi:MAG: hypothetical protein ACK5LK_05780 [Chthoniobacterales bacterium]